jgi:hypothetical protein
MLMRGLMVMIGLLAAAPAVAGELKPEEAKHFIAGKHFSYNCFEGTSGAGRVNADGSVVGTIQIRGAGPVHFVTLPVGTIRVQPDSICASVHGLPFQPCFAVQQTDGHSFRGSVSGLGFAYCDFTRRNPRLEVSSSEPKQPREPHESHPTDNAVMRTSISD